MTMDTQWPNSKSVRAHYPDTTFNLTLRPHIAFSQYNLIRHEIAHCYDLSHLYTDSGSIFLTTCEELSNNYCTTSEYLSDVFATGYTSWNSCGVASEGKFAGIKFSSNNVMGFESNYAWMSPLQMSRRTKNMYLNPMIRKFASNMAADTANPWVVDTNEVWDFDIQMYRNIVVDSGATLTIKCKVAMPAEGKIIVKKGAKLFIDGGLVTGWNTAVNTTTLYTYWHQKKRSNWCGIEIDGDPNISQNINLTTGLDPYHGIVSVKGGTISYARTGINSFLTTSKGKPILNTSGGITIVDSSLFLNNIYGIFQYDYQQSPCYNKVTRTIFRATGYSNDSNDYSREHIKLYRNKGMVIFGCTFEADSAWSLTAGPSGSVAKIVGVYATDSQFLIDRHCATSPCTPTSFNHLWYGVYIDNFNPMYNGLVKNCVFLYNRDAGILSENADFSKAILNTFYISDTSAGAYMYKSKYYDIRNNNFHGSNFTGYGVITLDSKEGAHEVYKNDFYDLNCGVQALDKNAGTTDGSLGLRIRCNYFDLNTNLYDIALADFYTPTPSIMKYQGLSPATAPSHLVKNIYGAPYFPGFNMMNKYSVQKQAGQTVVPIVHPNTSNGSDNPAVPVNQKSPEIQNNGFFISFNYASDCPEIPPTSGTSSGPMTSGNSNKLSELNTNKSDFKNFRQAAGGDSSKIAHYNFEIQNTSNSKLFIFLTDSLPSYKDSVLAELNDADANYQDADILTIFNHFRNGEIETAADLIDSLGSEREHWKQLLSHILTLETSTDKYHRLEHDSTERAFFINYATTDFDGNGIAGSIVHHILGIEHPHPRRTFSSGSARLASLSKTTVQNYRLQPNPSADFITLELPNESTDVHAVAIYDISGRLILNKTVSTSHSVIDINSLPNGLYLVKISSAGVVVHSTKLIKADWWNTF